MSKEEFEQIKREELPDDLNYQGISGDSYYLSFAHYWSKSQDKTYYLSYLGNWYIYKGT